MRNNRGIKRFEIYVIAIVAAVIVFEAAYLLSSSFSSEAFGVSTSTPETWSNVSAPSGTDSAAPLEPVLRTLDGVVHHG